MEKLNLSNVEDFPEKVDRWVATLSDGGAVVTIRRQTLEQMKLAADKAVENFNMYYVSVHMA